MSSSSVKQSYQQLDPSIQEFLHQKVRAFYNGIPTQDASTEEDLPLATTTPLVANVYIMTNTGQSPLKYELCPRERNQLAIPQTMPLLQKQIKDLTLSEEALKQSVSVQVRSDNPEFDRLLFAKVNGILPSCMFKGAVEGDRLTFRLGGRPVELILNQRTAPAKSLPGLFQERLAEVEYATYLSNALSTNVDYYFYDILHGSDQNREITCNGRKASREELTALKKFIKADTADVHTLYSTVYLQDNEGKLIIDFDSYGNVVNYYIDHEKGIVFLTSFRKGIAEMEQNPEYKRLGGDASPYAYEMIHLPKELFPRANYPSTTPPPHALLSNPTLTVVDRTRTRLTIDVMKAS